MLIDELLQKRVAARDSKHLDPSERAELVNGFIFAALGIEDPADAIKHPLYWDLISWCVNMLAYFAQGVGDEEMLQLAVPITKLFYSLHYALPDGEPELGPGREEHEKVWHERIEDYI